jgi:tetratricopeptide (TPR) repeat protein
MQDELSTALRFHQSGRLQEATLIYRSLLARRPDHADALHLLGVASLQQGDPPRAVELIVRAIALHPNVAAFHCNLAEAYRALGQFERAVGSCQLALVLQPDYADAANNLGLALLALGKVEAAIEQFREAVRLKPEAALIHSNLANALRLRGHPVEAIGHWQQALQLDANLAEAHSNLGQLLLERHQLEPALGHCREAVRLRPDFPEAHNNLGNALRETGHLEEAKGCYAEALRLNPSLAMTYNNLAQALQQEGQFDDALVWYEKALQREPGSAPFHCNLASLLEEQEKFPEAIGRYEQALRLDPASAGAHIGLGSVQHEQGDYAAAVHHYREAIHLQPDFAPAHSKLGHLLEELSEFDEALGCFREALRHDPRHAHAYAQMATMLRAKLPDADLAVMRQMLAAPELADSKRFPLLFGLAHVLDAQGAYDEAAAHLQQANALRQAEWQKRGRGYDLEEHRRYVDELIAAFPAGFFERVRDFGLESERPVFIVGLPRSGTTLTEQILASHSRVFGAGERRYAREALESLPQILNHAATPLECVPRLDRMAIQQVAQGHLDRLDALNQRALRVVDKMPDNYLNLGLIGTLFPRAKIIHCCRDVRDVAVSCWMTNFQQIRWASELEHIASRFREYRRVMDHWRQVLPVPLLEMDYEETVADLEGVARRLVGWCGLEWEPACLNFHESRRPVRTASITQVRQPIYTHSVARWKNYAGALAPLFAQLERGGAVARIDLGPTSA